MSQIIEEMRELVLQTGVIVSRVMGEAGVCTVLRLALPGLVSAAVVQGQSEPEEFLSVLKYLRLRARLCVCL